LAFSGAWEKPCQRGRRRIHRGGVGRSPRLVTENGIVRKYLAFLGIKREEWTDARMALASTTGEGNFGKNGFGSSGRTRTRNPSVNSRTVSA
jgi:hypothetical protein